MANAIPQEVTVTMRGERSERYIPSLLLFAAAIFVIECTGGRKKREGVVRNWWRKNKGRYVDGWQWLSARVGGLKNTSPISAFAIYSLISQCQLDALHTAALYVREIVFDDILYIFGDSFLVSLGQRERRKNSNVSASESHLWGSEE